MKKMKLAEQNGYRTYVVYVYIPIEVSMWRNRNRERFVPERVIMEQASAIENSFKRLKSIADKSKVVINFEAPELKMAKEDIALYPVPQDVRPPRPGDPDYGQTPIAASTRVASSGSAVGRVLDRYWNTLHDFEAELREAAHDYDVVASYVGSDGSDAAAAVRDKAVSVAEALSSLASGRLLSHLGRADMDFVRRHGDPDDYADEQSRKMFPR